MRLLTILIYAALMTASSVGAEVLFETNFDSIADWEPTQYVTTQKTCYEGNATCVSDGLPSGFDSWYMQGSDFTTAGEDTISISAEAHRGASGKALVFWDESGPGTGWQSDGQLGISLPGDYQEIYITAWVYFQEGWQWAALDGGLQAHKMMRMTHYDGTGNPYIYFAAGTQGPITTALLYSIGDHNPTAKFTVNTRGEKEVEYYLSNGTPSHWDSDSVYFPADWDETGAPEYGTWQKWEYYGKMNSAVGAEDGEVRFWLDGVLVYETATVPFSQDGGQVTPRMYWNYITLGGNNTNNYELPPDANTPAEQYWAIDDLVISTTRLPTDYVIGGSSKCSVGTGTAVAIGNGVPVTVGD